MTKTLLFWFVILEYLHRLLSLCSGQYDVYVEVDGRHKKVGEYDGQGFFGELALMYNVPRAATVVCSSPGCVWALVSLQRCSFYNHFKYFISSCFSNSVFMLFKYRTHWVFSFLNSIKINNFFNFIETLDWKSFF